MNWVFVHLTTLIWSVIILFNLFASLLRGKCSPPDNNNETIWKSVSIHGLPNLPYKQHKHVYANTNTERGRVFPGTNGILFVAAQTNKPTAKASATSSHKCLRHDKSQYLALDDGIICEWVCACVLRSRSHLKDITRAVVGVRAANWYGGWEQKKTTSSCGKFCKWWRWRRRRAKTEEQNCQR